MFEVEVTYLTPEDPRQFDEIYFESHVPLVLEFPSLKSFSVSHGPIEGDKDIYMIARMAFSDRTAGEAALASPQAARAIENLDTFAAGLYAVRSFNSCVISKSLSQV